MRLASEKSLELRVVTGGRNVDYLRGRGRRHDRPTDVVAWLTLRDALVRGDGIR